MSDWTETKKENYEKQMRMNWGKGYIDFSPESMSEVEKGAFKSYDEYLDVQERSCRECRRYFAMCYYNSYGHDFKGKLKRFDKTRGKAVFQRIMVEGMYGDGIGFYGKEDHVWMDSEPFAEYAPGDCVRFTADIYRYMKHGNDGKMIDFGLRNPEYIKKLDDYAVPTDEDLVNQQIEQLVCETCRYYDHCYMGMCIANPDERRERTETLKSLEPGKFTPRTVLLAYELEYRMLLQMGGIKLDKNDPHYSVMKKFVEICESHPVYYTGNAKEAFARMTYPEKPRLYIGDDEE